MRTANSTLYTARERNYQKDLGYAGNYQYVFKWMQGVMYLIDRYEETDVRIVN